MGIVRRKDAGEGIICVNPPMPGKAATPVAKLKHLPSSFIGGPLRFHPADWFTGGGDFLDTLRPKVNSMMTHFTADCRILQGQNTHVRSLRQDVWHCYYGLEAEPFAGRQRWHVLIASWATLCAHKAEGGLGFHVGRVAHCLQLLPLNGSFGSPPISIHV